MLWPCALVSFPSTGFTAYPIAASENLGGEWVSCRRISADTLKSVNTRALSRTNPLCRQDHGRFRGTETGIPYRSTTRICCSFIRPPCTLYSASARSISFRSSAVRTILVDSIFS